MVHTDGRPTIANAPSLRVTSRTLHNGVQEYVVKDHAGNVLSEPFASMALAIREMNTIRDSRRGK